MLTGICAALFIGVLVAAGCGGGGPASPNVALLGTVQAFRALFPAGQKSATPVGAAACAKCHAADCSTQAKTQHAAALVTCESCHGPGSVHVASPSLNNILNGPNSISPVVCAQCHSTEANDWNGSMHAQVITDAVSTTAASSTCTRCHSDPMHTLNIEAPLAQNPAQTPTQINTAILAISQTNLNALAVATHETIGCAGCHDPHQNTTSLTSAGNQYYLRALTSSTDLSSDPPGASVAQYTTVNQICGMCHNNRGGDPSMEGLTNNTSRPATHEGPEYNMLNGVGGAEGVLTTGGSTYYAGLSAPAVRTSTHVTVPDQCVTCHMPNAKHTFVVNLDVSCAPCHTATDAATRENTVQTEVQNALAALQARMAYWVVNTGVNGYTDPTGVAWDYSANIPSTVTVPNGWQSSIPIQIKLARHNYYFILLDRSYGVHNYVYTQYLLNQSNTFLNTLAGTNQPVAPAASITETRAILARSLAIAKAGHATQASLGAN